MNGIDIIVDSNIVIYFLSGRAEVQEYFLDFHPALSFISELEILSGSRFNADDYTIANNLLSKYPVVGYSAEMKDIIVTLRSKKLLKLPDAIVAATAIYHKLPLVSADRNFSNVKGLNFIYHEPTIS